MGQTDLLERLDHLDRVELLETEVYQDFQVPLDLEVNLVHLDPKEREEILVNPGRKDLLDLQGLKDPQVPLEPLDNQVSRDVLGKRVGLEEREARDTGDSLVSKVSLGLLDHQERKDPRGTQARTEWLEHLDQEDPLDLMGLLGPWEILVLWDLEDLQERREGEDLLEN